MHSNMNVKYIHTYIHIKKIYKIRYLKIGKLNIDLTAFFYFNFTYTKATFIRKILHSVRVAMYECIVLIIL